MLRLECLTAIKGFLSYNRKYGKAARPNQSLPTSPQGERRISPAKPSPEDPRAERTRELSPALGFHLVELCFILKALCMSEQRRERIGRAGSAAGGRASARRARVPHGDRPGLPAPPGPGAVTETHYASRRNGPQSHAETQQQPLPQNAANPARPPRDEAAAVPRQRSLPCRSEAPPCCRSVYDDVALFTCFHADPQQRPSAPGRAAHAQ